MNPISSSISYLDNSSEFLCSLTDTNFRFLHTNRLFQKQFGLECGNWKGRPFQDVVQTFQMEKYLQANNECINNPDKTICIEIQTTTASHETWFRWEVSALVNKKKQVEGIRFLGTDITKQKKAEQTLLQQATLLDNISDAIISADLNFCIKRWNRKAEMMFNFKYEKGKDPYHEISKVTFVNDTHTNFKTLLRSEGYWKGDVLIEKKDGILFHMQTMVNAIKDKTGGLTGFVAVSRDITKEDAIKYQSDFEEKKLQADLLNKQYSESNCSAGGMSIEINSELLAQDALEKSYELFEYAGKATRDVIWDWNLEENKIRRTGGYKNLFGYKMSNLYENHQYDKIHKSDIDNVVKNIGDALNRNDTRWQMEYKYLCADGSYKTVFDQAYIIRNKKGKAVRVIGSMQDVTEERKLQKQVLITEIQKKKDVVTAVIDAQEKERNELSAELHDNVNQLLAASILYLKTAQRQEIIEENLISQSIDYVQKAIDELRNISHNLTPSNLKMNGIAAALKALAEKLHIPDSFEVKLTIREINEKKLTQSFQLAVYRMVQEKINNILKHASATKVTINLCEADDNLILTVTDNGKGFDHLTIKKGLGITNIFNRAENLGGSAEIITSPGNGCTWNVKIPVN
jgi:PAS domain S-box-containing protein